MKSKIIFTIIFFSLLLNICHDLLIEKQFEIQPTALVAYQIDQKPTNHQTLDTHEVFHFSAVILKHKNIEFFQKFLRNMLYIEKHSPQAFLDSSFRPPCT